MNKTRKLTLTSLIIAITTISSHLIFIPVGFAKIFPIQHFANVLLSVLLGPWYALAGALIVSTLRNLLGTGSIDGDHWLTKVTGTGCMTTSLIASFTGTTADYFSASIAGMSVMSLAGERAKKSMSEEDGIGHFKAQLMDEIFHMNEEVWGKEVSIIET
ncbi:energy coupling factor transporter S component ThiW [Psychrobacillus sp. FJAT-21963]|uniref:energy coupling factor transporter S component ThiW n=1 Tax=Psychrobacillus sp. FJAT-21963 TaxID=1712028 RepID=UPI0009EA6556|nr:energy coupling factor transporter S component ThiW [Psychrobacillus sp. FJAT-21963]